MYLKLNRIFKYLCFILLVGCSLSKSTTKEEVKASHLEIFHQYGKDFLLFQKEVEIFKHSVDNYYRVGSLENLQSQLAKTRLAYKSIEFLFDYLEPNYAYLYVNGGPLPKLHKEVSEVDIVPPNGLQRLDELVFADELEDELSEVKELSDQLVERVRFIKDSHLGDTLSAQNAIEALRSGIVRVFSLGLTGFDTPGSGNAMEESLQSMQAMRSAFLSFSDEISDEEQAVFDDIAAIYKEGITQLSDITDFETFDRLTFLRKVVNPLIDKLYTFQLEMDISTSSLNRHAQNYKARNMFEADFLDRKYFAQFSYNDLDNPASIRLGKILFYDPILSNDIDLSCASCHDPKKGFGDGLPKSISNRHNVFTKRNSPTLIDAAYSTKYFWDMREHDLERQVAHVVEDALEFNIGFEKIAKRLKRSDEYVRLFDEAFGDISKDDINRRSISNAIAAYVNTLISFDSPFDKYARGESEELNTSAKSGFNLFMGKAACGTCHFAPAFNGSVPPFYTDAESEVLGVTEGYDPENPILDEDLGRSQNGRRGDAHPHFDHSFKTVTVRNAELTAPYMHNGLFETLDDVIDFYNEGGGAGMGIDIENQTLASDSLHLTEIEQAHLIDFLHSLTDTTGLQPGKIKLPTFPNEPYWNQRGLPKIKDD